MERCHKRPFFFVLSWLLLLNMKQIQSLPLFNMNIRVPHCCANLTMQACHHNKPFHICPHSQIIVPKYVPAFCWYYALGAPRPSSVVAARRPTTAAAIAKPSDQLTKGRTTLSLPCMHRASIRICKYNLSPSLVLSHYCPYWLHHKLASNYRAKILTWVLKEIDNRAQFLLGN